MREGVDQPIIMLTCHGTVEMCRCAFKSGGAEWGMACASARTDPRAVTVEQVDERLQNRSINDLRFYTARSHPSLFAWPRYTEKLGA